jgi:two-component system cell cycle sensor histidine kinase/response regulator CckA
MPEFPLAGVAHRINNLLTGIMGNASLLAHQLGPEYNDALNSILRNPEKAANSVRQLMDYTGQGPLSLRDMDIFADLDEMMDRPRPTVPAKVKLAASLGTGLPPACLDPVQFRRLLLNLVINGSEAIAEGDPGNITLATSIFHR